ncbi:MAG: hypothetical protein QOF72_2320 [Blastocatellia bacterium]|nr:hypothetical protein [Blastocatellia bacterium]
MRDRRETIAIQRATGASITGARTLEVTATAEWPVALRVQPLGLLITGAGYSLNSELLFDDLKINPLYRDALLLFGQIVRNDDLQDVFTLGKI